MFWGPKDLFGAIVSSSMYEIRWPPPPLYLIYIKPAERPVYNNKPQPAVYRGWFDRIIYFGPREQCTTGAKCPRFILILL